jgi:hypothetical protein
MIFLPRSPDDFTEDDLDNKITMKTRQIPIKTYLLTPKMVIEDSEFEKKSDTLKQYITGEERLFFATDMKNKEKSFILTTENLDEKLDCFQKDGLSMEVLPLENKFGAPWEQFHEFINDRSEFEAIADLISQCLEEEDRVFTSYDLLKEKYSIIWNTNNPNKPLPCLDGKDLILEPT